MNSFTILNLSMLRRLGPIFGVKNRQCFSRSLSSTRRSHNHWSTMQNMANTNKGLDGKYWNESAVLMFIAPRERPKQTTGDWQDYKVLMMKRSQKSSFMPNVHVFPGGMVNEIDYDIRWVDLYKRVTGLTMDKIATHLEAKGDRPAMIKKPLTPVDQSVLPTDLCFRITAIREAFEESGILMLCGKGNQMDRVAESFPYLDQHQYSAYNLDEWRGRVNKNAGAFLELCNTLDMVPNVWALTEWSDWITPVTTQVTSPPDKPRRYDTLYYVCFIPSAPEVTADQNEIVSSKYQWHSPAEFLELGATKKAAFLGPPAYELGRICNFSKLKDLRKFTQEREEHGAQRILGVGYLLADGYVSLQPGDALYPEQPDLTGKFGIQTMEKTIKEVSELAGPKHRKFRPHDGFEFAQCNISPLNGHLEPVGVMNDRRLLSKV